MIHLVHIILLFAGICASLAISYFSPRYSRHVAIFFTGLSTSLEMSNSISTNFDGPSLTLLHVVMDFQFVELIQDHLEYTLGQQDNATYRNQFGEGGPVHVTPPPLRPPSTSPPPPPLQAGQILSADLLAMAQV